MVETAFVQLFYFIALSSLCHFVLNSVYIPMARFFLAQFLGAFSCSSPKIVVLIN